MIPYSCGDPGGTLRFAVGCRFCIPRLLFLAGFAPEVAVSTTVYSSCAQVDLRHQVDMPHIPPWSTCRLPFRDDSCLLIAPTLYAPAEFAALYHTDKVHAIALVAAMTKPQRICQALAYAAWLGYYGLEIDQDTVLAAWEQR